LAEQVDRLSKKKQRRVLGRGSEHSFGSGANLLTGDAKPLGHKSSIVQIKIRPPAQLDNHEVAWCQEPYAEIRVMHQVRRTIAIPTGGIATMDQPEKLLVKSAGIWRW
jgi:hypothetical protein